MTKTLTAHQSLKLFRAVATDEPVITIGADYSFTTTLHVDYGEFYINLDLGAARRGDFTPRFIATGERTLAHSRVTINRPSPNLSEMGARLASSKFAAGCAAKSAAWDAEAAAAAAHSRAGWDAFFSRL